MQQWKIRAFIAVAMAISLVPLALCLPLWKLLLGQQLSVWRRRISIAGLGLATVSSFVPPLWILTMLLLSENGEASRVVDLCIEAVMVGMVAAVVAFLLLCFAKDRVRWVGLTACGLTVLLFVVSFGGIGIGLLR
jgi:hypothetical protein